jgi:TolB-like protein/cytochrome c-type biogenesis protein CcmH/NrfG
MSFGWGYNCRRMPLTSGTKLGPYEIQCPLGAGGMGEVYRATDTKLGRDVALKVLPAEMAQDPDRLVRFRREAKALAQLDHPNIVTIHSVEEADGIHFLTMQLVEGLPLDRLIPAGGLPVEKIVDIASALGEALAAAHEKGIVHRDLKPANVMVSNEGRVKVLDFGLAKDVRAPNLRDATMTSASQTQLGVVMGTPANMSPEQTSGRPLDHRTDIFSLGVVLHEMATGRRPFDGNSSAELVSAILRDTAPSVTDARPELPSDLARIIRRCLEKDPRHRVQTARDVSNEFRDLSRQTTQKLAPSKTSTSRATAVESGAVRADEGFWVAVLPFKYAGSNPDLKALAEGLSEEVVTGLSRFSYLRVIARGSTAKYSSESGDVRAIGKELGARYLMESSLRQAGSKLRLAVQLADTVSGAHLWAENYERAFSPETIFELQDDLVPRIVSTVADMNGILPRSMSEGLRSRPPEQLSPYEAVLRSFAYTYSATPEELVAARSGLEEAVRKAPAYADAWAMLSFLCGQDYVHGYELQANALEIATSAARRAVALGPSNHLAYFSLAQALWSQKDTDSFRDAAERAVLLNPIDGNAVAYLGELLTYAGGAERGMQLVERAKQLNPNHPGWYWFADFYHAYSQGDYRNAQSFALKAKLRGNPLAPMFLAAACGQLGDIDGGTKAADDLLKFRPELPALMRKQVAKVWNAEYGERFLEGLRKAGMEIPPEKQAAPSSGSIPHSSASADSGAVRADEGFWVAVLPFKYSGSNADLTALAEGLTEDVITGLSRFSYLRVIARGSTAKYSSESGDVRAIGKELGARYVMEGSLRQAGTKLRLAVQLVDATSGAHLWAENYLQSFDPESIFELQDELVPRIVATVADTRGVLPQTMSEALRRKAPDQLSPYEALLRSFAYFQRVNAEEHAIVRAALERAVEQAPGHADAWAFLSILYREEYTHEFNVLPDPIGRAYAAARRAIEIAPSNHYGHHALASVLFFRRELQGFQSAAQRAIALNSMDGFTLAYMGSLFAYSGEWERGCALSEKARSINPHHPGWYWFVPLYDAYRRGDYRGALDIALKVNMPGFWRSPAAFAAIYGQLGELDLARTALRELFVIRPDFPVVVRQELEKWWQPELVAQLIDGLRKAGLEIAELHLQTNKVV